MKKVVLRADGSKTIGLGHMYRLLALAEILKSRFDCIFVTTHVEEFLNKQLNETCSAVHLLSPDRDALIQHEGLESSFDLGPYLTGNEIVVTDGYRFGKNYQKAVKNMGASLVCIDDLATGEFYADAVINHAPGIDRSVYNLLSIESKVLTGLNYAILRLPFFSGLSDRHGMSPTVFVSFGGADPLGLTARAVRLLIDSAEFGSIQVLCSQTFGEKLLLALKQLQEQHKHLVLHQDLDGDEVVALLDKCTHAVVSASTVLVEAYARGLCCAAGHYVENQRLLYQGFINNRMAFDLGNLRSFTSDCKWVLDGFSQIETLKKPLLSPKFLVELFRSLS